MIVGSLGNVIFSVSSFYVKTITDLTKDSSARWVEHNIIGNKPKMQFQGADLEKISFKVILNAYKNVNPLSSAEELKNYMKKGKVLRFVLGNKKVGTGKFFIESIRESHRKFTHTGVVTLIELDISLKEYN